MKSGSAYIFRVLFRAGAGKSLLIALFTLVPGALSPLRALALREIIANVGSGGMAVWICVLAVTTFAGSLCAYASEGTELRMSEALTFGCERATLHTLAAADYAALERPETRELLQRASAPAEQALAAYKSMLALPRQLVSLVGYALIFAAASPIFLAGIAVLFGASTAFSVYETSALRRLRVRKTLAERKADYTAGLFSNRSAVREMKLFRLAPFLLGLYGSQADELIDERRRIRRKGFLCGALAQFINLCFVVGGAALALALLDKKAIGLPELVSLVSSLPTLALMASWQLPASVSELRRSRDSASDLAALERLPKAKEAKGAVPNGAEIRFEHVCFTYPGSDKPVLTDCCATFRQGECAALVGENGCGKSTMIKLMLGLYRPSSGRVTVGGADADEIEPRIREKLFSAVFQDYEVYETTVGENIAFADKDAERLSEAMDEAMLDPSRFPAEKKLGRLLSEGTLLSGGESQRVALARGLYARSAWCAMDEPTAALDPRAEIRFCEELMRLRGGRGLVVVTHRLAAARLADRIHLLSDGKIAEAGTHAELSALGGRYSEMWNAQSEFYKKSEEE